MMLRPQSLGKSPLFLSLQLKGPDVLRKKKERYRLLLPWQAGAGPMYKWLLGAIGAILAAAARCPAPPEGLAAAQEAAPQVIEPPRCLQAAHRPRLVPLPGPIAPWANPVPHSLPQLWGLAGPCQGLLGGSRSLGPIASA
ncbi:uncharacterized protein FN964_005758 [Alca torda]